MIHISISYCTEAKYPSMETHFREVGTILTFKNHFATSQSSLHSPVQLV